MAKSCTDCGLLLQVFVGSASLKGLTETDVMQVMNRCSLVKCSHVFKPQKHLGFCLLHFKDATDAACFYHTYASKKVPICQSLGGLYVQEAVFNGVKATYDMASLQHGRYFISSTGCCCATNTTRNTTPAWDPTAHAQPVHNRTESVHSSTESAHSNIESVRIKTEPVHIKTEPDVKHDILNTNECMTSSLARLKREVIDDEKALKAKYEKIGLLERLIALS